MGIKASVAQERGRGRKWEQGVSLGGTGEKFQPSGSQAARAPALSWLAASSVLEVAFPMCAVTEQLKGC